MKKLVDLLEVAHNDNNCVVFKVKPNHEMDLICLGCFDGDETMMRVTKNDNHRTYTFWTKNKKYDFESNTLVTKKLSEQKQMLFDTTVWDFGINLNSNDNVTTFIKKPKDQFKRSFVLHTAGWFKDNSGYASVHRDNFVIGTWGNINAFMECFKKHYYDKVNINIEKSIAPTGCDVWDFVCSPK